MKQTLKILFFTVLAVILQKQVYPQAIFDTLNLREFEIIALKNDFSKTYKQTEIDTLVRKEFENCTLGQILSAFSPVFIKSYGKGSIATASFRGTAASHTKVLWNGFTINSPMLGQVDFSYIPDSFFDEVLLLFGGGSLLKESGALGGAVLLNSYPNRKTTPRLHVYQSAGSFGTYSINIGINLGNKKFSSQTSAILQTSKNDFKYYNNGVIPSEWMIQQNASYLNSGFQQSFSYQLNNNNSINFITWNQWNNRNIPTIMTNVHKGGEQEEFQNDFFSRNILSWEFNKDNNFISVKTAYFFEDQHYFLKTTASDDSTVVTQIDSKNKTSGYYLKTNYKKIFNKGWKLNGGLDFSNDVVKSNNYDDPKSRNTTSLFIAVEKDFIKRLGLNFLLRANITNGSFLPLMPYAGINFKILNDENLFLRGTVSRNYHLPTLNDLYWCPGGNPDLLPEDGMEFDAGINYLKEFSSTVTLSSDVSLFYSLIDNWIQWTPSDYRFWSPQNIGFVKARGAEVSLQLNGSFKEINYRITFKYAYTKTTDESEKAIEQGYAGRQLIYIPVHHGNMFFFTEYKGWSFSWSTIFTGKRNTTTDPQNDYSNVLPYYALNDIQGGKKFDFKKFNVAVNFKVNNLFNIQYQAVIWRAMPAINFETSLKFNLK